MVYLAGWILIYFSIFLWSAIKIKGKFFVFVALLYVCALAFFRGSVGTDTANYEGLFLSVLETGQNHGFEPGFFWLVKGVTHTFEDPQIAVRVISLVFFALFGIYFIRANNNETFFVLSYTLPVYCYSYSMNGLKIGIASAVFLLAAQGVKRSSAYYILMLSSVFFHYSMVFALFVYWILSNRFSLNRLVGVVVLASVALFFLIFFDIDYLDSKAKAYQEFASPSYLSGLSTVIIIFTVIIAAVNSNIERGDKQRFLIFGFFFSVIFFVFSRYSYAGLRVLDLFAYVAPISLLIMHEKNGAELSYLAKFFILVAGFFGVVTTYKNFIMEKGLGDSPFLPYHSFLI